MQKELNGGLFVTENSILKNENGEFFRVLKIKDEKVVLINVSKLTLPFWGETANYQALKIVIEEEMLIAMGMVIPEEEELSEKDKTIMWSRYKIIAPLMDCYEDKRIRNRTIDEIAKNENVNRRTIERYLILYLAYQNISALVPNNKQKELSEAQVQMQSNFRYALNKWYYSTKRFGLKLTYEKMLESRYTTQDGLLVEDIPTYRQFYYYYQTHNKKVNEICSREGKAYFNRNCKPLIHNGVEEIAHYPCEIYFLDTQTIDIYLVSDDNPSVSARACIIAAIDAYSSMPAGYVLDWNSDSFSIKKLFENIITSKKEFCRSKGIEIEEEQWPLARLPSKIYTDRGHEFTTEMVAQLSELNVEVVVLDAFAPQDKSKVERWFGVVQDTWKQLLIDKGVVQKEYTRGQQNPRKYASLTLYQFEKILLKSILYYINDHVLEEYPYTPEMVRKQISPTTLGIYNYGISALNVQSRQISLEQLQLTMLPRVVGRFTRKGLKVGKLYYRNDDFIEDFLKAKRTELVAVDENDINKVYLVLEGEYIPFELIATRYKNFTLQEFEEIKKSERGLIKGAKQNDLQAKVNLISEIEEIADMSVGRVTNERGKVT